MSRSRPTPSAGSLWWLPLGALGLAWLFSLTPVYERLALFLSDSTVRAVAQPSGFGDVAVVDIDDLSLESLEGRLGPWPYRRDVYAVLIDYLRDAGAKAIVLDIVLAEPREGDDALLRTLQARKDVVLAAAGLPPEAALAEPGDPRDSGAALTAADSRWPAVHWPALALPAAALRPALDHPGAVGIVTASLDDDGMLRRMPLLNENRGQYFPALPLAAQLVAARQATLGYDVTARSVGAGAQRWPVDAHGAAALVHASNLAALPTLPFRTLMNDALGVTDASPHRRDFSGRTVFVGSSAFFGMQVNTPQGRLGGTAVLASAYDALGRDAVLKPTGWPWQLALAALALLPCGWVWRRGSPSLLADAVAASLALVAVLAATLAAAALAQTLVSVMFAIALIAAGLLLASLTELRWATAANRRLAYESAVAEAANRSKTQFLAHISHEIRTPMNAVLGMAEMLSRTELTEEQQRYVSLFRSSGTTLFELINDLLDLSKIEAGKLELESGEFSVRHLVTEQRDLTLWRADQKGLTIRLQFGPGSEGMVRGDRKRLGQILLNLMGNAVKFTSQGGVTVVVGRHGDNLHFTVSDTGIGIAKNQLERIFQPYVQAEGAGRTYQGTGLGLTITKSLVESMGGSIHVESEPGHGSDFHVELPLPTCATPLSEPVAPPLHAPDPASSEAEPMAILLAEDNEINVIVVEAMLQGSGHSVDVAPSGESALSKFATGRYGLVLMDVQMPGMGGLAATREMRRLEAREGRSRTPVLALTANAFEGDERLSLDAGCDGHLTKPISRDRLMGAIRDVSRTLA